MNYQLSRNGQMYGPYTYEDLQRYLATGNVLPTDLVKSAEMTDWIPVAQLLTGPAAPPQSTAVLGDPTAGLAQPAGFPQAAPAAVGLYPDPPNLNWGLLLLIDLLTCRFFQIIWNLVIAAWTRRVQPNSTALWFYIAADVLGIGSYFIPLGFSVQRVLEMSRTGNFDGQFHLFWPLFGISFVLWVIRLIARYQLRESLLQHFNGPEPIGLRLSGIMTFFFGGIYFQYHLNRINAIKSAARYGVRY